MIIITIDLLLLKEAIFFLTFAMLYFFIFCEIIQIYQKTPIMISLYYF